MFTKCLSKRGLILIWLSQSLALALPVNAWGQNDNSLSVEEMVKQLKGGDAVGAGEARTRGLRPGSAAKAASAASPDKNTAVYPGSLSMQVQFDFGSAQLSSSSHAVLQKLAKALASGELANYSFTVIGHTDAVGSASYNLALSHRRADSVENYLIGLGVQSARIKSQGKGFSELVDPDNPKAAVNRRVEVTARRR